MGPLELTVRLVAGLQLLLGNAFWVVTEFALTRLRQADPGEIEQDPGLETAWEMTERLEIYLTSCQVGITATSVVLGVVAEPAVTFLIRPLAELVGVPQGALPATSVTLAVVRPRPQPGQHRLGRHLRALPGQAAGTRGLARPLIPAAGEEAAAGTPRARLRGVRTAAAGGKATRRPGPASITRGLPPGAEVAKGHGTR